MEEATLSMVYRSLLFSILLSVTLFYISYFFYRSARKAGIFTTLLIIGFFTYGFIYDQIPYLRNNHIWPFHHIHRYLVVIYFIVSVVLFMLLYRSKRPHYNVTYILNFFVFALFVINASSGIALYKKPSTPIASASKLENLSGVQPITAPDVYYIILDGFASEETLQTFYGDPKPFLYASLRSKGFYIADSSRCNYGYTVVSLSSSLNMNYLDSLPKSANPYDLIRKNSVSQIFKANAYRFVSVESGYAITQNLDYADRVHKIGGLNEFERILLSLSFLKIDEMIGFGDYARLSSQLDRLPAIIQEKGPKFSFIHLISPHPPFVFNADGSRKLRTSLSGKWGPTMYEPRKDYKDQLDYFSKRVSLLVEQILASSKVPPIIIIQSDHGSWIQDKNPLNVYDARSRILNAYYVPDSTRKRLYKSITPVNTFRIILSDLFKLPFSTIPDSAGSLEEFKRNSTFQFYNQ